MPMLAPEKTKQARMWVYIGDEQHPYNIFDFTLSRGRDGPVQFLKGYQQTLLKDAQRRRQALRSRPFSYHFSFCAPGTPRSFFAAR
jgi:hypothetical protein